MPDQLLTITQVAAHYDVTPRMLRHYEKLGLLTPERQEDYAYRVYDAENVQRLQQIIFLRKLRLPLRDIAVILQDESCMQALDIVQRHVKAMNEEMASLGKVRDALVLLQNHMKRCTEQRFALALEQAQLQEMVRGLTISKAKMKERIDMEALHEANETMSRSLPVRIVQVPPCTMASYHFVGEEPETKAGDVMSRFVQESGLYEKKPDARFYGFNHPQPGVLPDGLYGYEVWVTVPENMEVPAPLEKKHFAGGLYAALTIRFGDFHRWQELLAWGQREENPYQVEWRGDEQTSGGTLEEHLNWVYAASRGWDELPWAEEGQIDLLLPIRKRK